MLKLVDKQDFMNVYQNTKVYGPYVSKQDGRLRVVLKFSNGKSKTVSYPKYLVEQHLNYYLDKEDTVDHIDGNFLNNDLSNLRVINRNLHGFQDSTGIKDVEINCIWCKKKFVIEGNKLVQRNRRKSSGFCSKSCTGNYGSFIQNGGKPFNNFIKFDKVYYKQKSALKVISVVEEQNIGKSLTGNADDNAEA